ncbi:Ribosomal protein S21 [Ostreococcus tauri]|uniref:Ribosomal protein S21 n=1 Tax=Ostreococcus tauri TaxID=70448 RepID=A0A096P9T5_OSTTA|nr:Ribosomal protein S21 [Ostreococcus tauri]CEG00785.1 Ribosomal protein S21 [Ostreococcus tauri]|eukprot:XP_022840581.1 Ribosomal protein S21 [Ostreococcus tauri]
MAIARATGASASTPRVRCRSTRARAWTRGRAMMNVNASSMPMRVDETSDDRARVDAAIGAAIGRGVAHGLVLTLALAAPAEASIAGTYADPKHPGCAREIFPNGVVAGEDGDPGCGDDDAAVRRAWRVRGTIASDGESVFVDFSPKGGPANVVGARTDVDARGARLPLGGVRFPDGNVWVKLK